MSSDDDDSDYDSIFPGSRPGFEREWFDWSGLDLAEEMAFFGAPPNHQCSTPTF